MAHQERRGLLLHISTHALSANPPFPQHPIEQGFEALQVVVCAKAGSEKRARETIKVRSDAMANPSG